MVHGVRFDSKPMDAGPDDPAVRASDHPDSRPKHRPAVTPSGRVKLLVAEDDRLSRETLAGAIESWGYEVTAVDEGTAALSTLLRADGPRLAVLDREMPGLSGIDVCRLLRARVDAPYVYIVICASQDGHRHVLEGLAAGADDYVRKPIDTQELELRLRAGRRVVLLQDKLLETQAEFERRALHDSLTGVKNRGAVLEALKRELSRSRRTGRPVSVVLADIDYFKTVNDKYGHPAGDEILREFTRRAKSTVRDHDIIGRYGGEEFLFVLPECSGQHALHVAERLRLALIVKPVAIEVAQIPLSASFGVAGTDQGHTEVDQIVAAADEALYSAKERGRNRVVLAPRPGETAARRVVRPSKS
jgi:diguanylate cyclase (GGDEF)-like protein